jgi:hypothetical protein
MARKKRQKIAKKRNNFLPTLVVILLLWVGVGFMVYFTNPDKPLVVPLFFLVFFLALLFTFSTLFANTRRGFLSSFAITFFLLLRYFGVGNLINLLLLGGLIVTAELYFSRA